MKSKIVAAVALLVTSLASQAVVVQYQTTFTQAVTTSTGALIPDQGGYTAIGYFSVPDVELLNYTPTELASAFQIFGSSGVFGFGGIGGVYDSTALGGRVGAASPFFGKNVYVLNTNAATILDSTQALIFKSNLTFPNDSADPLDASLLVELGSSGTYVFGGQAGPAVEIAPGFSVPTVQMAPLNVIPEPSAALLGAIGVLGLLRRRRA